MKIVLTALAFLALPLLVSAMAQQPDRSQPGDYYAPGNSAVQQLTPNEQDLVKEEQRVKASVEEEKQKILASAEQEIAAATMHAQKQLQQHAAELAIEQAARKLVVSAETDRLLVQGFARQLAGDDSKEGHN